jgi:hypothetical protein
MVVTHSDRTTRESPASQETDFETKLTKLTPTFGISYTLFIAAIESLPQTYCHRRKYDDVKHPMPFDRRNATPTIAVEFVQQERITAAATYRNTAEFQFSGRIAGWTVVSGEDVLSDNQIMKLALNKRKQLFLWGAAGSASPERGFQVLTLVEVNDDYFSINNDNYDTEVDIEEY